MEEKVLPVAQGDWIMKKSDSNPQIGRVLRSYWDTDDIVLVDVVLYDLDGNRIGRSSPAEGGPSRFEPAVCYSRYWKRIAPPRFPIQVNYILAAPNSNGMSRVMQSYGVSDKDERTIARKVKPRPVAVSVSRNFDPEAERQALLRAAQELRDAARRLPEDVRPALIARAETLEAEAGRL